MATLEQLQAQRARIVAAINGVEEVRLPDRSTTRFFPPLEQLNALAAIDTEIARMAGTPPPRRLLCSFSKGLR